MTIEFSPVSKEFSVELHNQNTTSLLFVFFRLKYPSLDLLLSQDMGYLAR